MVKVPQLTLSNPGELLTALATNGNDAGQAINSISLSSTTAPPANGLDSGQTIDLNTILTGTSTSSAGIQAAGANQG